MDVVHAVTRDQCKAKYCSARHLQPGEQHPMQPFADMAYLAALTDDTWVTADGTELRIHDMTDSHLANAIAFVERNKSAWLARYRNAPFPMFNGEMAQYYAERYWEESIEIGYSDDLTRCPKYSALVAEVERRRIARASHPLRLVCSDAF